MLEFASDEFKNKLVAAIVNLKKRGQFQILDSEDLIDPTLPDFNPEDFDDQVINWDDTFPLYLPGMEDGQTITYRDYIDLASELERIEFCSQIECRTNKRFLLRVEYINAGSPLAIWELIGKGSKDPPRPVFPIEFVWESTKCRCSLVHGITPFAVVVVQKKNYDDYYPPVLDNEFFVEVRCDVQISPEICREIAQAYLFELSSSVGADFSPEPREIFEQWEVEDGKVGEKESNGSIWNQRIRPLLLGKGMADLISLYNTGIRADDSSIKILFFTKVIEFVSQTVVRRKVTELGRSKLLSSRALNPDADFIWDLQNFFEEQRKYRQDQESIKLTVKECCDPYELKPKAPVFLDKLYTIGINAIPREKEEALVQFGEILTATRNMVVHAKSNYILTGKECPIEQIPQFAQCSRLAAEEAIRWFHAQHENVRIG